jgi:ATP-dependent DNA helicase RecG
MADTLSHEIFPQYRVGLLHGRIKGDGKDRVMRAFAAGEIQILVSTTVVEVGIDVANATVMIVEHAERFGLHSCISCAGASVAVPNSRCFLLYQSPLSDEGRERLKA